MAKKVKKGKIPQKEKRGATPSPKVVVQPNNPDVETVDDGIPVVKERTSCVHVDKVDLAKFSTKIGSSDPIRCEDCREGSLDRRGGKGKGKHGKKKGGAAIELKSTSKAIWVCLECGHYACGGVGFPTTPQSHAVRHARQTRHPLAIQFKNSHLRWCFPCNTLVPVEKSEDNGEKKDIFLDFVKLIKARSVEGASTDVEDVWFGSGSVRTESPVSSGLCGSERYVVRGLVNLGNTCFFNSVMQNLLAMHRLRDYLLILDESVGPLTVALKKLFAESSPEAGLRNAVNPKSFFGCVCAKAPQFRGYQQHDSHELLRCLLDGLCNEELSARKQTSSFRENSTSPSQGPTFVDAIFGGQISSTVCCLECGHSSIVYEPFLDLSLPVPTKKPPPKKTQPTSRAKKMKVPAKRAGRVRSKANKDADLLSAQSVLNSSTSSHSSPNIPVKELPPSCDAMRSDFTDEPTHQVQSSIPVSEKGVIPSDSTQLNFIGPITVAIDQGSVLQSFSATPESENKEVIENVTEETSTLFDNFWLDFGPGAVSDDNELASQENDILCIQDFGSKDISHNEALVQNLPESCDQVCSLSTELNLKLDDSSGNPLEDEHPLQLQGSTVLLLPYKEEISTTGETMREAVTSTLVSGCQEDSLNFDGFGDLFNEPEIVSGPNANPLLGPNNVQENDVTATCFIAGNISDSDPDEVDNTNSPVSIESCLAYFTKPELLSDEHAWHCENCSKILQRERMKAKKNQRKTSSNIQINGGETSRTDPLGSERGLSCPTKVSKLNNGNVNSDNVLNSSSECLVPRNGEMDVSNENFMKHKISQEGVMSPTVSQCKEGKGKMKNTFPEISSSSCFRTSCQASSSYQASDTCSINELSNIACNTNGFQQRDSHLLAGEPQSEESDEVMDSESVKLKRDATKRFLINKTPPILTIHLKRFSQDARGRLSKLNGHVDFRDTIDLKPYMDPRCIERDKYEYRLVGVVEHLGTMRGGHYVAYVRGSEKGRGKSDKENTPGGDFVWYYTSDAHVHEVSLEDVLRCEAYILFYEKI